MRTLDEKRHLALRLLSRLPISREAAADVFRRQSPRAPAQLIDAASFHLVVDLPEAILDLLAEVEAALSDPAHKLALQGVGHHVVYHLYNLLLVDALLPSAPSELAELVDEAARCLDDQDIDGAKGTLEQIRALMSGNRSPPEIP